MFGSCKYFNQFDVLWYSYLATNEIFENAVVKEPLLKVFQNIPAHKSKHKKTMIILSS